MLTAKKLFLEPIFRDVAAKTKHKQINFRPIIFIEIEKFRLKNTSPGQIRTDLRDVFTALFKVAANIFFRAFEKILLSGSTFQKILLSA